MCVVLCCAALVWQLMELATVEASTLASITQVFNTPSTVLPPNEVALVSEIVGLGGNPGGYTVARPPWAVPAEGGKHP